MRIMKLLKSVILVITVVVFFQPELWGNSCRRKNNYTIDVRDLGAYGDGIHNDAIVFRNILSGCPSSVAVTIVIPAGQYLIKLREETASGAAFHLNRDNVTIQMDENATLILDKCNVTNYSLILIDNAENVNIVGGALVGDRVSHDYSKKGTHEFGCGIYLSGASSVDIRNTVIKDMIGDGITVSGINNNDKYAPSKDVTITNCRIDRVRRNGISVVVGEHINISDNTITRTGIVDEAGHDGTAPRTGIDIEGGSRPKYIAIRNNTITASASDAINLFNGNHILVDGNIVDRPILYQNASNVNICRNKITIKGEINNRAAIGRTVQKSGVIGKGKMLATESLYEIVSQKSLDFRTVGALSNRKGTLFTCKRALALGEGDSVVVHVSNICIIENEISGVISGISSNIDSDDKCLIRNNRLSVNGTGITGGNATITGNIIDSGGGMGIVIKGPDRETLIEGNTISGALRMVYIPDANGGDVLIKNNKFYNPKPAYATASMIQGTMSKNIQLIGNEIINDSPDVQINYLVRGVRYIKKNKIINMGGNGVSLSGGTYVLDNEIKTQGTAIVAEYKADCQSVIVGNIVSAKNQYVNHTVPNLQTKTDVIKNK